MIDHKCDRCGWRVRGQFIEIEIEPRFLGVATDEELLAHVETDHLLKTGCMGSIVSDTWFTDVQFDWMMGRRGIPLSLLPKEEQDEIRGLR